jgi:hypothetical protein
MKTLTLVAIILAAALLAGCSGGVSLSEDSWFDNNCSGNGIANAAWCKDTLHPVKGPWAG